MAIRTRVLLAELLLLLLLLDRSSSAGAVLKAKDLEESLLWQFDAWVDFHAKLYSNREERLARQEIFESNVARWLELNQVQGGAQFGPHDEPYADLTADEFIGVVANCYSEVKEKQQRQHGPLLRIEKDAIFERGDYNSGHTHLRHPHDIVANVAIHANAKASPTTPPVGFTWMNIDWRNHQGKSYVTPVKSQGPHGTCWSFGAAENLEGLGVRQGYDLVNISEQEFISCCPNCQGASADVTFAWLVNNTQGHPALEDSYPYNGNVTACNMTAPRSPLQLHSWGRLQDTDGTGRAIQQGLWEHGPMGMGVDASCFQGYRSGIVRNCTSKGINHAVLMVAAGVDIYWNGLCKLPTFVKFFAIKNSWSSNWGENGYVRIEQGHEWWGPLNMIYTE